jgi:uncharacterized cupin superfamily protein
MEVLPELEPPFKTITGFTRSTIAGRCNRQPTGRVGQKWRSTRAGDLASLPPGLETIWHITPPFTELWVLA